MLKLRTIYVLPAALILAALLVSCVPAPSETPVAVNQAPQLNNQTAGAGQGQIDNSTPGLNENTTAAAQVSTESGTPVKKLGNAELQKLITGNPANIDNSKYEITPVGELHTTGNPRQVDISQYRLTVDGQVDHPLSLSYEDLLKYPTITETVLLICPDFFVDNAEWTGVPLETLLQAAGIQSKAAKIAIIGMDSYRQTLARDDVENGDVFLAYNVDGLQLPEEHGFPLRLVVKGSYGNIWVKWVQHIEVD
ncbi:MAG: molybdopterin-dependent oxidoreductase [Dehalococcoidia bacterium]